LALRSPYLIWARQGRIVLKNGLVVIGASLLLLALLVAGAMIADRVTHATHIPNRASATKARECCDEFFSNYSDPLGPIRRANFLLDFILSPLACVAVGAFVGNFAKSYANALAPLSAAPVFLFVNGLSHLPHLVLYLVAASVAAGVGARYKARHEHDNEHRPRKVNPNEPSLRELRQFYSRKRASLP
jgi:hypothetical protein